MNGSLAVCTHAYSAQVSVLVEQVPGEGGGGGWRGRRGKQYMNCTLGSRVCVKWCLEARSARLSLGAVLCRSVHHVATWRLRTPAARAATFTPPGCWQLRFPAPITRHFVDPVWDECWRSSWQIRGRYFNRAHSNLNWPSSHQFMVNLVTAVHGYGWPSSHKFMVNLVTAVHSYGWPSSHQFMVNLVYGDSWLLVSLVYSNSLPLVNLVHSNLLFLFLFCWKKVHNSWLFVEIVHSSP